MRNRNFTLQPLIVLLLIIFLKPVYSQEGSPFITHFKLAKNMDTYNWSICQDNDGLILLANRKGIYTFDDNEWQHIETPSVPYAIKKAPDGTIFVGCKDNFGYLIKDSTNLYTYYSLSSGYDDLGEITEILFDGEKMFFYSPQHIISIDSADYTVSKEWLSNQSNTFTGIIKIQNDVYVNIIGAGLHKIENDTIWPIKKGDQFADVNILFYLPYNKNQILFGTSDGKLLLFDGKKFTPFKIEDDEYLSESILLNGAEFDENRFILTTLAGGCLIIDKKTKKTLNTINFQTGLPDDEVYALYVDLNLGLWVTHQYGMSRIDTRIPIKNYAAYPGLPANINALTFFKGTLYIASNSGVYHLEEVRNYQEIEVLIKKRTPTSRSYDQKKGTQKSQTKSEADEEKKEGFKVFNIGKKKKSKQQEAMADMKNAISKIISSEEQPAKPRYKTSVIKKKTYALQSISHTYKKEEGLDEKCTQLLPFENKLIIASNNGLYQIEENNVSPIIKNVFVSSICKSKKDSNLLFIGSYDGLYMARLYEKGEWDYKIANKEITGPIYSIAEDKNGILWLGSENTVYKLPAEKDLEITEFETFYFESDFPEKVLVREIDGKIYFLLLSGIYAWENDSMVPNTTLAEKLVSPRYFFPNETSTWLYDDPAWYLLNEDKSVTDALKYIYFFDDISTVYLDSLKNVWVINSHNELYKINAAQASEYKTAFNVFFKSVNSKDNTPLKIENLVLDYKNNSLSFHFSAPLYLKKNSTEYAYLIEGMMDEWSQWSKQPLVDMPYLPNGTYTIKIVAKNILGQKSEVQEFTFTVEPPFWKELWFYGLCAGILIVLVVFIIVFRERKLKRDKRILEEKVRERTAEVVRQKNEIAAQKKEIEDSIIYAKRIQNAILPKEEKINKMLPEYFILFKPRDIVSGDFYWISTKGDKIVIVAADCTGHGVPGAFMSMLGVSFLNEIVNKSDVKKASDVLNKLRESVISTLSQEGVSNEAKDGMDMSLGILDLAKHELQFAGAYNPLYLIRNGELIVTDADNMPVAIHERMDEFTNHVIKLEQGDIFYLFSDGFADQFGGDSGKKFLKGKFKKLLAGLQDKSMADQKKILDETLEQWKGNYSQVDDILVIGVRV
ncbi:MAG: SpoIIE family protein phosphatase [Bacteroidales bacterium]|nr:SpoIIE family protein phosphatase [Bacteroidales bacterium]